MASVKDINGGYCDSIDKELSGMRRSVDALRENLIGAKGSEHEVFRTNERHLVELAATIDQKHRILMQHCPIGSKVIARDDSFMAWFVAG